MSINNGQPVDAANSNAAWVSRIVDSSMDGKLNLKNVEHTEITDAQRVIADSMDTLGFTEGDTTRKDYSSNNVISNGDAHKVAIGKLDNASNINATNITTNANGILTNANSIAGNYTNISNNTSDISDINNSIGAANGIASLDNSGKVPTNQMPAISLTDVFTAADEPSQLALTVQEGDVCKRSDLGISYWALNDVNASMSDWTEVTTASETMDTIAQGNNFKKITDTEKTNYDSHIVSTSNPHNTLLNVTNDAQLKASANDYLNFTEKLTPVNNDLVLIEDSEDAGNKKRLKLENMIGGSGGGAGGINWVTQWNFNDSKIDEWVKTGTGDFNSSLETTNPINGTGSLKFTKGASDASSTKYSYTVTIDKFYASKMVDFSMLVSTDGYDDATQNMIIRLFDSAGNIIYGEFLESGNNIIRKTFQAIPYVASSSLNYFIELIVANNLTNSYSFLIDEVKVGPQKSKVYGNAGWKQYDIASRVTITTPDGAVTYAYATPYKTLDGTWNIKGYIKGSFTSQTGGTINASIGGIEFRNIAGFFQPAQFVVNTAAKTTKAYAKPGGGVFDLQFDTTESSFELAFDCILESKPTWAVDYSNVVLSETTQNREIYSFIVFSDFTPTADNNWYGMGGIALDSSRDDFSVYDSVNGNIVIPEDGLYSIEFGFNRNSTGTGVMVVKIAGSDTNGVSLDEITTSSSFGTSTSYARVSTKARVNKFKKGTVLVPQYLTDTGGVFESAFIKIVKLNTGSQTIAQSEKAIVDVRDASGLSYSASTFTTVSFATKKKDTLNAFNFSQFVAPRSGDLNGFVRVHANPTTAVNTSQGLHLILLKNGSIASRNWILGNGSASLPHHTLPIFSPDVETGDVFVIQIFSEVAGNLSTSENYNQLYLELK